ncbi:MAG: isoleucine--tRNA ligase [Candidatus Bathyarchaeota archaeon]|nr:isoleucine--tRNA ligase [Candidatus Bathyarchaeota archaeon]
MTAKFQADSNPNLSPEYRPLEIEREIRDFWEKNRVKEKLAELRMKNNVGLCGWVEGPPTLNGIPHVGHARGRVIKDLRYRWRSMQGYFMPFWAGWDCQGLPVELEVEKILGVKNKRELIEKVGEERFVEECKKTIMRYHKEWVEADRNLGIFMDQKKAYWTYLDEYIEREWQYLKRAWEQGLLEEGYYVVAYCPGCQTSLSSAEVGYEGSYKEVEDPSLYFKFKVAGYPDLYFLVWTTMPFTLVTDLMLAVHPDAEYAKVQVGDEKWIIVQQRVEPVMQELGIEKYTVLETVNGKGLEGLKYDYPFKDLIPKQAELDKYPTVHTVVCEDFVDVNTASGVVHLSPGNGEEDFQAAIKRNVPIFAPFDDDVKFTGEAGFFSGVFAREADTLVIEELRRRGLLVQVKTIRHEYPTCWRSHHRLIWLARREYFLRTDRINRLILEAADKVEYFFEPPKNRFISFLKEGKPWCISRERVWGAPLPIWVCEKCKSKTFISSKRELLEKAIDKPAGHFELHKPWIDRIQIKCEKCGGIMRREPFVLDTWHNSGASPYARFTDEEFQKYVPVEFLTEGIDQTRGWANSLLLEHVILTGKPEAPYKAFLFQGLTQDAKGRKMSKSLGNIIEVNKLIKQVSADVCRFYMLWKCSPIDFMNFDLNEMNRRPYQVLSTLYHLHKFFIQNAEYDNFNPQRHKLEWARTNGLLRKADMWLLSKLQKAVTEYTAKLERCEFNTALGIIEDFTVEIISRLYIPMIRKELWTDDPETLNRRLAIYACLWHVLKTLVLLFNPITPFLSEALYQKVYRKLDPSLSESVNFEAWPKPDEKLRDPKLEEDFETLFKCLSLVNAARQSAKIKRRWPLRRVIVQAPENTCSALQGLNEVFLELANVKTAEYLTKTSENVEAEAAFGKWVAAAEKDTKVYLDIFRDEKLLGEGLMRDVARRIQALRKELGYNPTDILETVHVAGLDLESIGLLQPHVKEMNELVRAKNVQLHVEVPRIGVEWHEYLLDDKKLKIAIIK